MKKIILAFLALCCAIQTHCSTENIVTKSHDSEYRDRIQVQQVIPTLHEIALNQLEKNIPEAVREAISFSVLIEQANSLLNEVSKASKKDYASFEKASMKNLNDLNCDTSHMQLDRIIYRAKIWLESTSETSKNHELFSIILKQIHL